MCYECKKLRHIMFECPFLKKQSKRPSKKAMVATWSDSDASNDDSDDDEVANLCLMAIDDSKEHGLIEHTGVDVSLKTGVIRRISRLGRV